MFGSKFQGHHPDAGLRTEHAIGLELYAHAHGTEREIQRPPDLGAEGQSSRLANRRSEDLSVYLLFLWNILSQYPSKTLTGAERKLRPSVRRFDARVLPSVGKDYGLFRDRRDPDIELHVHAGPPFHHRGNGIQGYNIRDGTDAPDR